MVLNDNTILKLKELGLRVTSYNNEFTFSLPESDSEEYSQLNNLIIPILELKKIDSFFNVSHWEWSPGPGPGDFSLNFSTETEVVEFIISYYFGTNPYREKIKAYANNHRKSYNSKELKFIFQKLNTSIQNKFGEREIDLNERGTYHKISIEEWNITEAKPEKPTITVGWGYLNHELGELRDKILKTEDFTPEDIEKVASLLMDLSINLKKEAVK